jgi:hypothetical protein
LIEELHAEWDTAQVRNGYWYDERTLAYAATQPYGQLRQHLYSICGIAESDSPPVMRDKLAQMLDRYAAPDMQPRALKVYTALLGLEDRSEGSEPPLTGDAFKRELFDVVMQLQRAVLADRP